MDVAITRAALAALLLAVAGCAPRPSGSESSAADGSATPPAPGVVDGRTAASLAASGALVVDVRTPQEFASGHVPGAINVPFDELPGRAHELGPPETAVVLYCRSGRRSAIAAGALRRLGFGAVYDAQRYDTWPVGGADRR